MGSHSLLQPFPSHSPGIEPESLALQADSFYRNHLSHQGRGTMSRPFHVLSYLILRTAHDLGILLLSQIKELVHRKIKYLVQGQTDTSDRAKTWHRSDLYQCWCFFYCILVSLTFISISNSTIILGEITQIVDVLSGQPLYGHLLIFLLKSFQHLLILKLSSLRGQLEPKASPLQSNWQPSLNPQCFKFQLNENCFPRPA